MLNCGPWECRVKFEVLYSLNDEDLLISTDALPLQLLGVALVTVEQAHSDKVQVAVLASDPELLRRVVVQVQHVGAPTPQDLCALKKCEILDRRSSSENRQCLKVDGEYV